MNQWELALLDLLANHVRLLAVAQVVRASLAGQRYTRRHAASLAQQLVDSGWLRMSEILARPLRPLHRPLCLWRHSEPMPDLLGLSRRLHQRASFSAAQTVVVSATRKTQAMFGNSRGIASPIKLTQATHDLHVAEVYFHYAARGFQSGIRWVSEDCFPETWTLRQRPDALLIDDAGEFVRAVEYGGDYSWERLAELHDGLASIPLPYEIW
jgi:hypothetical protein